MADKIKEIGVDPNPPKGTYSIMVHGIMSFMEIYATFDGEEWTDIAEWDGKRIWWFE